MWPCFRCFPSAPQGSDRPSIPLYHCGGAARLFLALGPRSCGSESPSPQPHSRQQRQRQPEAGCCWGRHGPQRRHRRPGRSAVTAGRLGVVGTRASPSAHRPAAARTDAGIPARDSGPSAHHTDNAVQSGARARPCARPNRTRPDDGPGNPGPPRHRDNRTPTIDKREHIQRHHQPGPAGGELGRQSLRARSTQSAVSVPCSSAPETKTPANTCSSKSTPY